MSRSFYVVCFLGLAAVFTGCRTDEPAWPQDGKIRVLTTFTPLYCFAQNVAGDDAHVLNLTSEGPHEFRPHHRDHAKVRGATVIFAHGLNLDDFMAVLANANSNAAKVFKVADMLPETKL